MRNLVKYSPGTINMLRDFDRVFDSFFNDSVFSGSGVTRVSPRVDIREDENGYVLEAELPGLTEKDIDVRIDDNLLTVSSKHDEEKKDEKDGYLLRERRHSSFTRSFVLPKDVDKSKIEARFSNGLLSLSLSKLPETKPKTIEIKGDK